MTHFTDLPCAAQGLTSYRYKGPYGWIMIGARDIRDAIHEANRSLEFGRVKVENLQIWNKETKAYIPASHENTVEPISEHELVALIDEGLL